MVKRCLFCGRYFTPDYRVKDRQKSCRRPECRKARKKIAQVAWVNKDPLYFADLYETYVKPWRKRRGMIKDKLPPEKPLQKLIDPHPGQDDEDDKRRDTAEKGWHKDVCGLWIRIGVIGDEMDEWEHPR